MRFQISMMVLSHGVFHGLNLPVVSKAMGRICLLKRFLVPWGRLSYKISFFLWDLLGERLVLGNGAELISRILVIDYGNRFRMWGMYRCWTEIEHNMLRLDKTSAWLRRCDTPNITCTNDFSLLQAKVGLQATKLGNTQAQEMRMNDDEQGELCLL